MTFEPIRHHRRSIRLKDYDYSQAGAYYVTICTELRGDIFGHVAGDVHLNEIGIMIQSVWQEIPIFYPGVELDESNVMPDHLHGIVVLTGTGQPQGGTPALRLDDVIGRYKSFTTNRYCHGVRECGWPPFQKRFWERNYFEHVIRNEEDLNAIREYITTNPIRWMEKRNLL